VVQRNAAKYSSERGIQMIRNLCVRGISTRYPTTLVLVLALVAAASAQGCFQTTATVHIPVGSRFSFTIPSTLAGPVDLSATAGARALLSYYYSLEGKGLILSNQDVTEYCDGTASDYPFDNILTGNCSELDADNTAGNGGVKSGEIDVGPCNGYYQLETQSDGEPEPLCNFSATGSAAAEAEYAWSQGQLVGVVLGLNNPFVNWNNANQEYATSSTDFCAGNSSGTGVPTGGSIDCTNATAANFTSMLTSGTAYNTQWQQEIDQNAGFFKILQSQNIPVLVRLFSESNDPMSGMWPSNIPCNLQAAVWLSIQARFEADGVHNVLYGWDIWDTSPVCSSSAYPGVRNVDVDMTDFFGEPTGATQGYNTLVSLGGNKLITCPECLCSLGGDTSSCFDTYDWDEIAQAVKSSMPNMVECNVFGAGANPGDIILGFDDPYWPAVIEDAYTVMQPNIPASVIQRGGNSNLAMYQESAEILDHQFYDCGFTSRI
jgi:hypothetical protein